MVVRLHRFQLTVVCDSVAHYHLHCSICSLISLSLLLELRLCDHGCYICDRFFGCFLYGDDIIIPASSLLGLQSTLDTCTTVCKELRMKLNNSKSYCIVFGKCPKSSIDPMHLDMDIIYWTVSVKYLGVLEPYCYYTKQEAQLSQRDCAAAYLNFDKNISANSVHLTLLYVRALTSTNHHFTVLRHHVCT